MEFFLESCFEGVDEEGSLTVRILNSVAEGFEDKPKNRETDFFLDSFGCDCGGTVVFGVPAFEGSVPNNCVRILPA